jgi:hypothetical protein
VCTLSTDALGGTQGSLGLFDDPDVSVPHLESSASYRMPFPFCSLRWLSPEPHFHQRRLGASRCSALSALVPLDFSLGVFRVGKSWSTQHLPSFDAREPLGRLVGIEIVSLPLRISYLSVGSKTPISEEMNIPSI